MSFKKGKRPLPRVGNVIDHHYNQTAYRSYGELALASGIDGSYLCHIRYGRKFNVLPEVWRNLALALAIGEIQAESCQLADLPNQMDAIWQELMDALFESEALHEEAERRRHEFLEYQADLRRSTKRDREVRKERRKWERRKRRETQDGKSEEGQAAD